MDTYGGAVAILIAWTLMLAGCDLAGPDPLYTPEEIQYFQETVFGFEYGYPYEVEVIHKWAGPIRLAIRGEPTRAEVATIKSVAHEIEALPGTPRIDFVPMDSAHNAEAAFLTWTEFEEVFEYAEGNVGGVSVLTPHGRAITWSNIYIVNRTEKARPGDSGYMGPSNYQIRRNIREELTQLLGILRDSDRYPDSIFYQYAEDVSDPDIYAPIDKTVIEMLYRPDIAIGMTEEEAVAVLRSATK